jgi:fucose 4-O-acetylase-like acetyltransferase
VLGHAERGLVSSDIAQGPAWSLFDLALYSFHMPLFMLLAGINTPRSLARGTRPFLAGKLRSVAYPYVLWSLLQGSALVLLSGITNSSGQWSSLLKIGWQPIAPFWFLYALMVYFLLVALVGLRAIILIPIALAGLVASGWLVGESMAHQLCYQFAFFLIGALGAEAIKAWQARPALLWIGGLALGWLAAFQLVPQSGPTPFLTPLCVPAALAGIGLVLAISRAIGGPLKGLLVQLGQMSMAIYVMHILATAGARIAMTKMGFEAPALVYLLASTFAGIVLPVIAFLLMRRLRLLPWFGLGR